MLLEGTRAGFELGAALHTLEPLSSVLVDPEEVRQLFNDTDSAAPFATERAALSPTRQ